MARLPQFLLASAHFSPINPLSVHHLGKNPSNQLPLLPTLCLFFIQTALRKYLANNTESDRVFSAALVNNFILNLCPTFIRSAFSGLTDHPLPIA